MGASLPSTACALCVSPPETAPSTELAEQSLVLPDNSHTWHQSKDQMLALLGDDQCFVKQFSPLCLFAHKDQTMIIFDWDDTIFPTTYFKTKFGSDFGALVASDPNDKITTPEIEDHMERIASKGCALLALASSLGNCMILTLAGRPWVTNTCKMFAPALGDMIDRLGVTIVYAREFGSAEEAPDASAEYNGWLAYWSAKKAAAISAHLDMFYSQYEGQSWKNVISIGDSDIERLGTEAATSSYIAKFTSEGRMTAILDAGLVSVDGESQIPRRAWRHRLCEEIDTGDRILKLRAKTIKAAEFPSPELLCSQLDVVSHVITDLVSFDSGIDINLNLLTSESDTQDLSNELRKPGRAIRGRDS